MLNTEITHSRFNWVMIVRSRIFTAALTPCLRHQLHIHSKLSLKRNFHASQASHNLLEVPIQLAGHAFEYVHVFSGLPWAVSIPLTAIIIRTCVNLPVYYFVFSNQRKAHAVAPLMEAYRNAEVYNARRMFKKTSVPTPYWKLKEYRKEFGIKTYVALLPLAYLPVWLASISALAQMSGAAPLYWRRFSVHVLPPIPNLASEGLLWFTDLTAFDPPLCAIFGFSCIVNAFFGLYRSFTMPSKEDSEKQLSERISFMAMVGALSFLCQVPASVALFGVSSSLCALVQRTIMKRLFGSDGKIIQPARAKGVIMRQEVH